MATKKNKTTAISSVDMTNILAHAHARANKILNTISNKERLPLFGHLSKLVHTEPADIWTILSIISSATEKNKLDADTIIRSWHSKNARKSRSTKKLDDREIIFKRWQEWQRNKTLYPNQKNFIYWVMKETTIKRVETVAELIRGFKKNNPASP